MPGRYVEGGFLEKAPAVRRERKKRDLASFAGA